MSVNEFFLHKMHVNFVSPIQYELQGDENKILLNDFLNRHIKFEFLGEINCIQCGRKTKKSFQQGYCFPCMQKINDCNNCMIHPERCLVELGGCDPSDWAHRQCHQSHIVYLANSSALKVGITREKNVPSRWIDQGAAQGLPIFRTQNRYQAGIVEVALKAYVADKTNWRTMLKEDVAHIDLLAEKKRLLSLAQQDLQPIFEKYTDAINEVKDGRVWSLDYPVVQYPVKVSSMSFDKTPVVEGVLQGIKGQYLILNTGVVNIRKFGGYRVAFSSC